MDLGLEVFCVKLLLEGEQAQAPDQDTQYVHGLAPVGARVDVLEVFDEITDSSHLDRISTMGIEVEKLVLQVNRLSLDLRPVF